MILIALAAMVGATVLMIVFRALWIRSGLNARQTIATLVAALFIVVVVGLAATGRLNWIAAAVAALIPFLQRVGQFRRLIPWLVSLFGVRRSSSAGASPKPGTDSKTTTTESPWLRMTLHHASGHMDGEVKKGRHLGRFLSELRLGELTGLFRQIDDYDSQRLLETYLDHHYPNWRQTDAERPNTSNGVEMTRSEALEALGLSDEATRDEVIAAHRRLIQKLHPDRGGSTYLAALLNRAKDVLIKDH